MNLANTRTGLFSRIRLRPGLAFAVIIILALLAFEMFNYSTTEFALNDLLGNLKFFDISWATILSIAFCGIDFAGIARLFTPEQGAEEPKEVWYLFGAWMLAATMNAILTWWGVSMAIANHQVRSTAIIDAGTVSKVVPVFVAVMVWVIRILIIGTLSVAGDRLLNSDRRSAAMSRTRSMTASPLAANLPATPTLSPRPSYPRPMMNNRASSTPEPISARPEPTYHTLNASARNARSAVEEPGNGKSDSAKY